MSYNNEKTARLKADITSAFTNEIGIQTEAAAKRKRKRADVSKKDDSKKETAKPKASSSGGEHPTGSISGDEHPTLHNTYTPSAAKRRPTNVPEVLQCPVCRRWMGSRSWSSKQWSARNPMYCGNIGCRDCRMLTIDDSLIRLKDYANLVVEMDEKLQAGHKRSVELYNFVQEWMTLSHQTRKDLSHEGAIRCTAEWHPQSWHYEKLGWTFDPGNWVYGTVMRFLIPRLQRHNWWNDETLGDIVESILAVGLVGHPNPSTLDQGLTKEIALLMEDLSRAVYSVVCFFPCHNNMQKLMDLGSLAKAADSTRTSCQVANVHTEAVETSGDAHPTAEHALTYRSDVNLPNDMHELYSSEFDVPHDPLEDSNSGDAHPTDNHDPAEQLHRDHDVAQDITQLVRGIEEIASMGSKGDSTEHAAQSLMTTIHIEGTIVRDPKQVLAALAEPIRRRRAYVDHVAHSRGVAQPTASRGQYAAKEWIHWYQNNPLTEEDFEACLNQWKSDLQLEETTLAKIEKEEAEGKKGFRKKIRGRRRGAFKGELKKACINYQLALGLLKHPPVSIHTLLKYWSEYMMSPGYQQEKNRSRKVDEEDEAAVAQKEARIEVKSKLYKLRHKMKQVQALKRKSPEKWTAPQNADVAYYESGRLTNDLDELTKKHGYGRMHGTDEFLKPARWDSDF
jgi:hypothetical protein